MTVELVDCPYIDLKDDFIETLIVINADCIASLPNSLTDLTIINYTGELDLSALGNLKILECWNETNVHDSLLRVNSISCLDLETLIIPGNIYIDDLRGFSKLKVLDCSGHRSVIGPTGVAGLCLESIVFDGNKNFCQN